MIRVIGRGERDTGDSAHLHAADLLGRLNVVQVNDRADIDTSNPAKVRLASDRGRLLLWQAADLGLSRLDVVGVCGRGNSDIEGGHGGIPPHWQLHKRLKVEPAQWQYSVFKATRTFANWLK